MINLMIFILEMLGTELDQHNVIRCLSKPAVRKQGVEFCFGSHEFQLIDEHSLGSQLGRCNPVPRLVIDSC